MWSHPYDMRVSIPSFWRFAVFSAEDRLLDLRRVIPCLEARFVIESIQVPGSSTEFGNRAKKMLYKPYLRPDLFMILAMYFRELVLLVGIRIAIGLWLLRHKWLRASHRAVSSFPAIAKVT